MALYKDNISSLLFYICSLIVQNPTATEGIKNISLDLPRETISVCPEEPLLFKCTTNTISLRWTVTIPQVENDIGSRTVTHTTAMILPITIMSYSPMGISFNVSRLSANGTLPVVSTLNVPNAMIGLNGTEVECSMRSNLSIISMVAVIHVINSGSDVYPRSNLNINSTKIFMANAITLILEWKEEAGVRYTANIHPATQAPLTSENARLELKLSYNTVYHVNITAVLCGQNSINTALNYSYAKCLDTFHEVLIHSTDSDIFLEGANVIFSCPPGRVLVGHNTSTCMGNGKWEPDPRDLECIVHCDAPPIKSGVTLMLNSTLEGSQLVFWCNESPNDSMTASCLSNGRWSVDTDSYNCPTDSEGSNNQQTMVILLVVIIGGCALLLLATLMIVAATVVKIRGARIRKLPLNTGVSSQEYHTTRQYDQTSSLPPSEYSLIQYSAMEEPMPRSKETDGSRKNRIVYADIGPRSFETKKCVCPIDIQSHRVEYVQVNHGAKGKTPKLELKDQSDPVGPDTLINLDSLLIQLQTEVTPKWYEFGEVIGVGKKVLEKYKQYPPEQSIIEILDNWLRNHAGQPTWREIAEALREIGLQELAFDIERVYDTGKLPIEINMSEVPMGVLSDSAEEIPPPIPPRLLD